MENRLRDVMAAVFGIDKELITGSSSPETIEEWDSLKQMNLILAIEEEFEIQLDDDDVVEMLSFDLIAEIVKDKLQ